MENHAMQRYRSVFVFFILLVAPFDLGAELNPPIITPVSTARTFELTASTEGEAENTIVDFVREGTDVNGAFVVAGATSSIGVKGSTASGSGRFESNISTFKIRAEGEAVASATTSDSEGISGQINAFTMQFAFTVPSEAIFSIDGIFEASGSGASGAFGAQGGQASVSLRVQGVGSDGFPWVLDYSIDDTDTEPLEFVGAQAVLADSQITVLLAVRSTASNDQPGSADSSVGFDFEIDFGDDDDDGLLDVWEEEGIDINDDGSPEIDLPAMGADPQHKNLFVELDAHAGVPVDLSAINDVEAAFMAAPANLVKNPNGQQGVILFIMVDETDVAAGNWNASFQWPPEFDAQKASHFGTPELRANAAQWDQLKEVYKLIFRYCAWAEGIYVRKIDSETGNPYQSFFSGIGEVPGNDFIVAAGAVSSWYSSPDNRRKALAGTLMHELGHTLNLRHGGQENLNYKPNYLSSMNYAYQLPMRSITVEGTPVVNAWFLDYAQTSPPKLDEKNLREDLGYGGPSNRKMIFNTSGDGMIPELMIADADAAEIDWNLSGLPIETDIVEVDLSRFRGTDDFLNPPHQAVSDWNRIWYHLVGAPDFADGSHTSFSEVEDFDFDDFQAINGYTVHDRSTSASDTIFEDGFEDAAISP